MSLGPKDVNSQTFRVTFRGFDPVEVDAFLKRVADELERLADEKSNLEIELDVERASRKSLEETLEATSHIQAVVIEKAREEARLIIERAKLEGEKMLERARDEYNDVRRQVAVARERRASALAELGALAHGVNDWIARFEREFDQGGAQTAFSRRLDRVAARPGEEDLDFEDAPGVAAEGGFVLTDQRADMIMDIHQKPDTYVPPAKRGEAGDPAWTTSPIERVGEMKVAADGRGEIVIPAEGQPELALDLEIPKRKAAGSAAPFVATAVATGEGSDEIEVIDDFTGEES